MKTESIYNLVPKEPLPPRHNVRYRSKHSGEVSKDSIVNSHIGVTRRRVKGTMGPPRGVLQPDNKNFLKKHSKEPVLPPPNKPPLEKMKLQAPVPRKPEKPQMGLVTEKNYITSNALEVINANPAIRVITTAGDQPKHMYYGRKPAYLETVQAKIEVEKATVRAYLQQQANQDSQAQMTKLDEEEKQDLLRRLRDKRASVNQTYQKLPFTLDTPSKKKRKENFEQQLAAIEKDIATLERGDIVMVMQT